MTIVDDWRPETRAGGFARDDEAFSLYSRVDALVRPDMTVVDLGAGRGSRFDDTTDPYMRRLCNLQPRVKHLIGLDVDPAVKHHPALDEAHVIEPDGAWPITDGSVDMVVAEWVIEHVEHPRRFAAEVARVLKPGGWFCALTPNLYGYVGLGNALVPERLRTAALARLWPERPEEDAFPTHYRLNTPGALARAFGSDDWEHHGYTANATPKYHGGHSLAFAAVATLQALAPPPLRTNLLVFSQRR